MYKQSILLIAFSSFLINISYAETAQVNIPKSEHQESTVVVPTTPKRNIEKYPSPEEIDKMLSIHFPEQWAKKHGLKYNAADNSNKPKTAKDIVSKSDVKTQASNQTKPKDTIRVRHITVGNLGKEKLEAHRATDTQKLGVNIKYTYDPKVYTPLPNEVKNIALIGRINSSSIGSLRIYRDVSNKYLADAYFLNHQRHSELFSAYLARRITLNRGVVGEKFTLQKAFTDEMNYKFSDTPVVSVHNTAQAEDKYLYILLRLTPSDRVQFWKYINTMRQGDTVSLPSGLTIADVLTADL